MSVTGPFAVVGPSGVGKDTVMEAVRAADPTVVLVRRVITRPAEAGGEAFDGVDRSTFETMKAEGLFALDWEAHGLAYGIPVAVERQLAQGHDVLANLSRGVLRAAQLRFPRFVVLSLTAPASVLAQRLAGRGRESAAEIERRLERSGFPIPEGLPVIEVDNSGALSDTVAAVRAALQPASA